MNLIMNYFDDHSLSHENILNFVLKNNFCEIVAKRYCTKDVWLLLPIQKTILAKNLVKKAEISFFKIMTKSDISKKN